MKKISIDVKGMHCRSCEVLIEDGIRKLPGTKKVKASTKDGRVEIYGNDDLDKSKVLAVIKELGYEPGRGELSLFTNDGESYKTLVTAGILVAALFVFAKAFGLERFLAVNATNGASLFVVFTIGLTAGLSTCMALVGGLVLGVSARFSELHPNVTPAKKFQPHLFFNLGRIISYFVLGGVIGVMGSFLKLSSPVLGTITLLVGVVMLLLGIQITEISPKISHGLVMPKFITRALKIFERKDREYSHLNSMILGAMTFFLPCGFTQAMQVYAISTGSFAKGAMIMGVFALGTTPGLLGIGGLVSYLKKGYFSQLFFKFIGIVVVLFALYNISTGWNLSGFSNKFATVEKSNKEATTEQTTEGVQLVKAKYDATNGLSPTKFTVKAGQSVRLEVYAEDDGFGCMGSIMIPGLVSQPRFFQKGQTAVLEFTPPRKGSFKITCAMGVPSGTIVAE